MSKTYNTTGIVLRRYDYREHDRLFVLYTEDFGKIEVVAKGTKKILSKLNPHLEPFNQVKVMVAKGRGYDKLANAIVINDYPQIRQSNNFYVTSTLNYVCEVTEKFVPHRYPDLDVYTNLTTFLEFVAKHELNEYDLHSLYFMANTYVLKLLDLLGHRPELGRCTECARGLLFPKISTFDFLRGGLVCESCKHITIIHDHYEISDSIIKIFNLILGENYETLRNYRFNEDDQKLCNIILPKILTYQLERPLNSLDFLASIG